MKVWTNTEFKGHYPVGTAAAVVADTAREAAALLNAELKEHGLEASATADQFVELSTAMAHAVVLCDGNY